MKITDVTLTLFAWDNIANSARPQLGTVDAVELPREPGAIGQLILIGQ